MSAALQGYITARHPYGRAADEVELALYSRHVQQLQNGGVDLLQQQQQQQELEQPAREQGDPQPQPKKKQQQQLVGSVLAAGQQQSTQRSSNVGDDSDYDSLQDQPGDFDGGTKTEL
jgi:hypothetical protein